MKIRKLIAGLAVAGLCIAVPQFLSAQDQSTSSDQSQSGSSQIEQSAGAGQQHGMSEQEHAGMTGQQMKRTTPTDINKASKLIGMDVRNQKNEKLGTIRDLVVDPQSQRVAYAVMEKQDTQGDTGDYVAVPLNVLTPSSNLKHLVLNADKQRISSAKGFERNQFPTYPLSSSEQAFWRSISEAAGAAPGQHQQQQSTPQSQQ